MSEHGTFEDPRRFSVERVVARLAIRFMMVEPERVDEAVEEALAELTAGAHALGAAVALLDEGHGQIVHSYEWTASPRAKGRTCRRGARLYCLPWFRGRLAGGERIEIRSLADLPAEAQEERRMLERRRIGSALLLPVSVASRPVGFLALAGPEGLRWSADDVAFYEVAADLFGRLFERCGLDAIGLARRRGDVHTNAEVERFAYEAAHDLKAPLMAISGYLDLIDREHGAALGESASDLLDRAGRAVDRMHGLIDTLLDYFTLGTKPPQLIKTDCQALLEVTCEDLATFTRERGATIEAEPLPVVAADPVQLRRVFQNLLTNAIKFGGSAPRVRVSAHESGGSCVFTVRDAGPGIDPKDRERIFEPFQRLRSDEAGSGVGLAICKKVVELHGGRIWVESEPGGGSAFRFTLPSYGSPPLVRGSVRSARSPTSR